MTKHSKHHIDPECPECKPFAVKELVELKEPKPTRTPPRIPPAEGELVTLTREDGTIETLLLRHLSVIYDKDDKIAKWTLTADAALDESTSINPPKSWTGVSVLEVFTPSGSKSYNVKNWDFRTRYGANGYTTAVAHTYDRGWERRI